MRDTGALKLQRTQTPLRMETHTFLRDVGEMCVCVLRSGTERIKAKGYSHTYSFTKLLITPDSLSQRGI